MTEDSPRSSRFCGARLLSPVRRWLQEVCSPCSGRPLLVGRADDVAGVSDSKTGTVELLSEPTGERVNMQKAKSALLSQT